MVCRDGSDQWYGGYYGEVGEIVEEDVREMYEEGRERGDFGGEM